MTQQAIADTLGISQGRVSQILNEKEKQAGSPAAEEREQRILQLDAKGLSQRAIAAELGVSQSFVFRTLRQARTGGGTRSTPAT